MLTVYLGPARSGKTWELVRLYREALRRGATTLERALWLAPNARSAATIRQQLLAGDLDACLQPGVLTFAELTDLILAAANNRHRRLSPLAERELLRRVVQQALDAGALQFFAETAGRAGFLEPLAAHLHELKRRGISPDDYAKTSAARARSGQHQDLARLYADYDQQLSSHRLLDAETAHCAARDALANGACRRFQNLELVVVDGFTDFTNTQQEILQHLAERAKQLIISLPADAAPAPRTGRFSDQSSRAPTADIVSPTRPDLFAKSAATLAELRRNHSRLEIRELPPRPAAWPALDHLAQHIFSNPANVPAPSAEILDSLSRLEIVAAAGAHDEIVQIARRIKQRLVSGTNPADIVVVFRSLADAAPRVREVFEQFGIPYFLETALPVATAPLMKSLLSALRLDSENWPFRRVVSVVTNNTFSAIGAPERQAADWLIRELQIADGRDTLLERVATIAAIETPLEQLSESAQRRVTASRNAMPALGLLADALNELPREVTPNEWRDALAQLGAHLGLAPFQHNDFPPRTGRLSDQSNPAESPETLFDDGDRGAWQCIVNNLAALERFDAWLGQPPRKLSRSELISTLADVSRINSLPRSFDDVGRVRVLGAPSARTVSARHLFLAGMSELSFPSPERPGQLATDSDYRFFARAADQARSAEAELAPTRASAEMLLFYEVLTRAEESLTISYPALDDKAQELPPSPYVVEIERTLGAENLEPRRTKPQLSPVPLVETPFDMAEWRQQAIAQAIGKNKDLRLLSGLFQAEVSRALSAAIDSGLRIIHARSRGDVFGPAEGLLASPAIAARLARRFGPEHLWSPSQWERYAACPFKFYLEDVLGLAPLGDLTLEVDHLRRGSLVHDVLATFHQSLRDAPAELLAALERDEAQFMAQLAGTLDKVMSAGALPRAGLEAALVELDRRQIQKWIAKYREQLAKYDGAWAGFDEPMRPAHFELRFGRAHPGQAGVEDPDSVNAPFPIDIGGEQVLVTGRIDRIDVGRAGGKTVFNVIDYKSGLRPSLTGDKIESGERLQPALYVMAAQAMIFGDDQATPVWAGYWSMKNGVTTDGRYSLKCSVDGIEPTESWQALQPKVVARIGEFVRAIRAGGFPVFSCDANCTSRCEFHTVCRVSQVRSLNKIWPPEVESQESRVESQNRSNPSP